jgi:hypothetical protein
MTMANNNKMDGWKKGSAKGQWHRIGKYNKNKNKGE